MPSIQYTVHGHTVIIETPSGFLELTAYSDCIVRVRLAPTSAFSTKASLMIQPTTGITVDFEVRETSEALWFSTPKLSIQINRQTGAFTYLDGSGQILTKEPDRGGKTLVPVEVVKSVFDETVKTQIQKDVDGVRALALSAKQVVDRQAFHTKLEFEWLPGEALYGLGSHEEGMMNLRGQHQYLYQQNMKVVVPVLLSTRGYGLLLDSYSMMSFHDDAFGSYLWTDVDDELDYYFIYGPEFDQIVQRIRQLTGKTTLLPRWAFGYIQSKETYRSQTELLAVVQEYRQRGLPLDCIVQDWKSWPNDLWGQKTFDPERFPNPQGLMADLHRLHTRLMISIWPIMDPGGGNWREMRDQGCLLGNQATYDAFQAKARALYWKQANEGLFAHGLDAWWCDCTEPFQSDWSGAFKPEPEERQRINTEEAKRYLDPEYINAYSLLHSQGIYEGQRQTDTDKRVVNLTRSAYAGQQRYGTITWSGDVSATWDTLRRQIADGLNFCATGLPYWTVDVGAFFVKNDPNLWFWSGDYDLGVEDLGYRELYVRWFQYGAFLPMFRAHGTDTPREIWRFGEPGDLFYDTLVKFLRLRYRLMPYIYSLAGLVTHENYTMLRALPFDFRCDPNTYNVGDQFMFGPAFLVNPVTQPMYFAAASAVIEGAAKTRPVYLPQGADWYDFWTGQRYAGGQTICAEAALDTLPLYVRSGAIVPVGPDVNYADEQPNAPLELHIYPGQDGRFTLYDDEGDNYNYEQGHFALIRLSWDDKTRQLTLHERQGQYPGMSQTREFRIIVGGSPYSQPASPDRTVLYEGRAITIDL
ncbi:MAG TPA: TIM-barrel domain-containing protein [Phototrophicaceae bacterium]|nr:TIM-barrel domain-containing protein [Phototrophicaceae bacterium]